MRSGKRWPEDEMRKCEVISVSILRSIIVIMLLISLSQFLIGCAEEAAGVMVIRAPFTLTVQATGEIKSSSSTIIGCPSILNRWEYTLATLVPEGTQVNKGDLLVTFDTKSINEQLLVRRSELETARKELERLRISEREELDTLTLSLSQYVVTREKAKSKAVLSGDHIASNEIKKNNLDYELATVNEQLARNRVESQKTSMVSRTRFAHIRIRTLERSVLNLKESVEKMKIMSPSGGIVVYSSGRRGQKVKVGETIWFGQTILELPDLSRMEMKAVVAEKDAGQVRVGQRVEIRLDANPEKLFHGSITSLGRVFREKSFDQPIIVFDVTIPIDNPDAQLMRPGMAAKANILVSSDRDILQIPAHSLVYTEDGPHVIKITLIGSETLVPIRPGRQSGGMIEVMSGLDEGDRIIIPKKRNEDGDDEAKKTDTHSSSISL